MSAFSGSGSTDLPSVAVNSTSCDEYKDSLTGGLAPYQILNFVTPHDDRVWTERGDAWTIAMKVYIGLLSLIYFMLGMLSFVLIFKRDCVRLPTKTFFTVYLILAIMGFSRALHMILDPYSLLGFIGDKFGGWIIFSRLFATPGFPSLVACCTLIIFTLLKITKARVGKQWYHYWRYVIPIAVAPYIIAFSAEIISYSIPYPALITIIACEAFFALWGISICIAYLFVGIRLLRELNFSERRTMRISASVTNTEDMDTQAPQQGQNHFAAQEYQRHHKRTRKTARKISIITYGSALIGVMYALVTSSSLIMVCLLVFHDCLGLNNKRGSSVVWLALQAATRITEITLALVIFYSITDVSGVVNFMKQVLSCSCCRTGQVVQQCNNNMSTLNSLHSHKTSDMCILTSAKRITNADSVDNIDDTDRVEMEDSNRTQDSELQVEAPEIAIEMETEDIHVVIEESEYSSRHTATGNPRAFMLNAQTDSASSIDTGSSHLSCTSPARSVSGEPQSTLLISVATNTDSNEPQNLNATKKETSSVFAQLNENVQDRCVTKTAAEPPREQQNSFSEETRGMSSVATQTVDRRSIACQTEPPSPQKPVPKPRRFLPGKPPNKQTRRQRLREQQQQQRQLKDSSKSLFRKQTV